MSEFSFEGAFECLETPLMAVDREYRFVAANRAYQNVTGKSREQLMGRVLFDVFPNEGASRHRLRAALDEVFETGYPSTIAFIPYEIPNADGTALEERFWTATHTPVFGADGKVASVVQNTVDVTDIAKIKQRYSLPLRHIPSELALLRHAQELEEAYQETASESAEFRRLFRQAPGMIAVLDGPDHVFTFVNDAFTNFFGPRELVGRKLQEAVPELRNQKFWTLLEGVFLSGQPVKGESMPLKLARNPGCDVEDAFIDFTFSPIRDEDGSVIGIFVQSADRTEFMHAVERQRHLIDELNHRVKNTLSTVQSMARQSFRKVDDADDARYAFEARIMALSQAHNVLSARRWEAAGLIELLDHELSVFDRSRLHVAGPEIHLTAKAAIALAMVLHELASNAVRYGAMSRDHGSLDIQWVEDRGPEERRLTLIWREHVDFGEAPHLPADGFGMRMMRRVVEGELGGRLTVEMPKTGLICRLEVQLSEVEDRASTAA